MYSCAMISSTDWLREFMFYIKNDINISTFYFIYFIYGLLQIYVVELYIYIF